MLTSVKNLLVLVRLSKARLRIYIYVCIRCKNIHSDLSLGGTTRWTSYYNVYIDVEVSYITGLSESAIVMSLTSFTVANSIPMTQIFASFPSIYMRI